MKNGYGARVASAMLLLTLLAGKCLGQHAIVLRDLTLIRTEQVSFSETEIRLSEGRTLTWESVLKARVAAEDQERFDDLLKTVGLPRFRFLTRLDSGNYQEATKVINELPQPLAVEWKFQVECTRYNAFLEQERWEQAALAFVKANRLTSQLTSDQRTHFKKTPWARDVLGEPPVSPKLLPIFFDPDAARIVLHEIETIDSRPDLRISIYGVGCAIACKDWKRADHFWLQLEESTNWKKILKASIELEKSGSTRYDTRAWTQTFQGAEWACALWLAALQTDQELTPNILPFLRAAALCRDRFPAITSGALARAIQQLPPDSIESNRLKQVLLKSHPNSFPTQQLVRETGK